MSTPEHILNKIKLLFNLKQSSNSGESANAELMANNLINKYGVTAAELKSLEDKKPVYSDDDKLYSTIGIVSYQQQLALAIGKYFFCHIIQEELVPVEGLHQFTYYVYGEPEDAANVKFVFDIYSRKVKELIDNKCLGRGAVYIDSYAEGLVEAVNSNIYWEGIDIPGVKGPSKRSVTTEYAVKDGEVMLATLKEEKEKPIKESVDVKSQSNIRDAGAFFKGMADGRDFYMNEILELEADNERIKELSE